MLKIISKEGALRVFFFLISVDGVTEFELERFDSLGTELLGSEFYDMKNGIIAECRSVMDEASNDDYLYDIIQEGIDQSLNDTVYDVKNGVVPRLLIWNMLTLAHSDNDFSENENRLISHVVRILEIDKSVYAEMKQLIASGEAIQKQKDLLDNSERPYSEIRPIADEIENRRLTIIEAAKALIEDDLSLVQPEPEEKKIESLLNTGKRLEDVLAANSRRLGEKVAPVAKELGGRAGKGASDIKEGAGKLFGRLKNSGKRNK